MSIILQPIIALIKFTLTIIASIFYIYFILAIFEWITRNVNFYSMVKGAGDKLKALFTKNEVS